MIRVLVLICSATLDHAHCVPGTARASLELARVSSMQQCAFQAQTTMARTVIIPDRSEYMMIGCRPERMAAAN